MEAEKLFVYKLAIETGFLLPEELERQIIDQVEYQEIPDIDYIELLSCKKSAKALSICISNLLADKHYDVTCQRMEAAAKTIESHIGNSYLSGKLTLEETCGCFGRLGRYRAEYDSVAEAYELYQEGIALSIDDVRRVLYDTLSINTTEIPLAAVDRIENKVLYYRDTRGDIMSLDLEVCKEQFKKNALRHPDEYPDWDPEKNYVAEACQHEVFSFFLFHTPRKTYFSIRQEPSILLRFAARKSRIKFQAFQQLLTAHGYCTYDLNKYNPAAKESDT